MARKEKLLSLEGGLVERVGLIVVWLVEERTEHIIFERTFLNLNNLVIFERTF